jgi:hypothetical protein
MNNFQFGVLFFEEDARAVARLFWNAMAVAEAQEACRQVDRNFHTHIAAGRHRRISLRHDPQNSATRRPVSASRAWRDARTLWRRVLFGAYFVTGTGIMLGANTAAGRGSAAASRHTADRSGRARLSRRAVRGLSRADRGRVKAGRQGPREQRSVPPHLLREPHVTLDLCRGM